ncbi:hypothetical protein N9N08_00155 [bacterium]|nr:hypothetical protein [bacterium]
MVMIYTFGCSYTYGVKDLDIVAPSWPEQLAEMLPDQQIEDYSFPGTSLQYSIYNLNRLKRTAGPEDIFVFQITVPYRYTNWRDELLTKPRLRKKITPNYTKYDPILSEEPLGRYGPHWNVDIPLNLNPDERIFKSYYTYQNAELEMSTYYTLCEYVRSHTDYCFKWTKYSQQNSLPNTVSRKLIPSIKHQLSPSKWNGFQADEQCHFNLTGSQWVAEWVAEQLNLQVLM